MKVSQNIYRYTIILIFSISLLFPQNLVQAQEAGTSVEGNTTSTETSKEPNTSNEEIPNNEEAVEESPTELKAPWELDEERENLKDKEDSVSGEDEVSAQTSSTQNTKKIRDIKKGISKYDGSFNYSYNIEVPQGRNAETTPNHNLIYRSNNRVQDGILPFGWELDIPYIERTHKRGTENTYKIDEYKSSIDDEIVKTSEETITAKQYDSVNYTATNKQKEISFPINDIRSYGSFDVDGDYLAVNVRPKTTLEKIYIYKKGTDGTWTKTQELPSYYRQQLKLSGKYMVVVSRYGGGTVYKRNSEGQYIEKFNGSAPYYQYKTKALTFDGDKFAVISLLGATIFEKQSDSNWTKTSINPFTSSEVSSISISNNRLALVARNGESYVYKKDGSNWVKEQKIKDSYIPLEMVETSGIMIRIDGNTLVISSYSHGTYIYERVNGNWELLQQIPLEIGSTKEEITKDSISLNNETIVIGYRGRVYTYKKTKNGMYDLVFDTGPTDYTKVFQGFGVDNVTLHGDNIYVGVKRQYKYNEKLNIHEYNLNETTKKDNNKKQTYKARVEKGLNNIYTKTGNSFVMTNKNGTKYYFGQSGDSRQEGYVDKKNVTFKWMLDRVEDLNGNEIKYTYENIKGQIYPSKIEYVNNNNEYVYSVKFNREEKFVKTFSYNTMFPVYSEEIITSVDIYKGNTKLYSHIMDVEKIEDPIRAQYVSSIYKQNGAIKSQQVKFDYHKDVSFREQKVEGYNNSDISSSIFLDLNGDSIIKGNEIIRRNSSRQYFDYNGDGILDYFSEEGRQRAKNYYINLGTHNSIIDKGYIKKQIPEDELSTKYNFRIKERGAGAVNLLNSHSQLVARGWHEWNSRRGIETTDIKELELGLNKGGNFDNEYTGIYVPYKNTYEYSHRRGFRNFEFISIGSVGTLSNINGDDILDSGYGLIGTGLGWKYYYIDRKIFYKDGRFSPYPFYPLVDVNSDGLTDIIPTSIYEQHSSKNKIAHSVYLNSGDNKNFYYSDKYTKALEKTNPNIQEIVTFSLNRYLERYSSRLDKLQDYSGDGLMDAIKSKCIYEGRRRCNTYYYKQIQENTPLSLKSIQNEYGGKYNLKFESIAEHSETNKVPYPVNVVTEIEYVDDYADNYKETIEYRGARQYFNNVYDKKFAGFETITNTIGNKVTKTYYHQGNENNSTYGEKGDEHAKINLPYKEEIYEKDGETLTTLQTKKYTYTSTSNGTNSNRVSLTKEENIIHNNEKGLGKEVSNTKEYTYDSNLNPTQILTKIGDATIRKEVNTYSTNTSNNLNLLTSSITKDGADVEKQKTTYTYDSKGNLTRQNNKISTLSNQTRNYTYNTKGQVLTQKDSLNNTTTYTYDTNSLRLLTTTNPKNQTTTYTYNDEGQTTKEVDSNGLELRYTYDSVGRLIKKEVKRGSSWEVEEIYEYNFVARPYSVVKTIKGANDQKIYTYFDGMGNELQVKSTNGSTYDTLDKSYNEDNLIKHSYFPYSTLSNSYTTIPTNTQKTTTKYDALNRVISINSPITGTTTKYDALNREILINSPIIVATTTKYSGNTAEITTPENRVKRLIYDGLGRLIKVEEKTIIEKNFSPSTPIDKLIDIKLSGEGLSSFQQTIRKDGDTRIYLRVLGSDYGYIDRKSFTNSICDTDYDINDIINIDLSFAESTNLSPRKVKNADGTIDVFAWGTYKVFTIEDLLDCGGVGYIGTKYTYDSLDRLIKIEDVNGNIRDIEYDKLGRTTKISDLRYKDDTTYKSTTFAYNKEYQTRKTNQDGTTINYTYDSLGRITNDSEFTYTYDNCENGKGRLCKTTNNTITTEYKYNKGGTIKEISKTIDSKTYTTKYEYDVQGRTTKITHPNLIIVNNSYGNNGQISVVSGEKRNISTFTYNSRGQLKERRDYLGTKEINTYDVLGRLTQRDIKNKNDLVIRKLQYIYDKDGNITQTRDTNKDNQTLTKNYTYDDLNRLTKAVITGITGKDYTRNYTYDYIGNITSFNGTTYTYTSNNTDYLNPHQVKTIGTNTYTYDLNGNTTNDGTNTMVWDKFNRLKTLTKNNKTHTYNYDYDGSRIKQTNGTNTTLYISPEYTIDNNNNEVSVIVNGDSVVTIRDKVSDNPKPKNYTISNIINIKTSGDDLSSFQQTIRKDGDSRIYLRVLNSDYGYIDKKNFNDLICDTDYGIYDLIDIDLSFAESTNLSPKKVKNADGGVDIFAWDTYKVFTIEDTLDCNYINNNITSHFGDNLGSTIISTKNGEIVQEYLDYYPYGEVSIEDKDTTSPHSSNYTHTQNITDDTGLIYRNARYYNPQTGRFISIDPIVDYLGDPQSFEQFTQVPFANYITNSQLQNTYSYAMNNPITHSDREGKFVWLTIARTIASYVFIAGSYYTQQVWHLGVSLGQRFSSLARYNYNNPQKYKNFTKLTKNKILVRDGKSCRDCGRITIKATPYKKGVKRIGSERQIDHISPKSKGGTNNLINGQVLCRTCNIRKSNSSYSFLKNTRIKSVNIIRSLKQRIKSLQRRIKNLKK